jgi:sugar phosphate isomerase/epimerase
MMSTSKPSDRLAVCSWSLRPASPAELARHLEAIGIRRAQLAIDPIRRGGDWTDGFARLADLGITVSGGMFEAVGEDYSTLDSIRRTGGIVPDATWPETFEHFRQMTPMASKAGLDHVTFHAGFLPHEPSDPTYATLAGRLVQVADLFADHGLTCCLETGQEDAATLSRFLEDLGRPNVGINFDPANLILYDKGDPIAGLEVLLPHVRSCHIKDATRTRTPGTWGAEVVVGTGEVDWPAFFATLAGSGFAGTLAIEREAGDQRVADIKTARALARGLLDEPR